MPFCIGTWISFNKKHLVDDQSTTSVFDVPFTKRTLNKKRQKKGLKLLKWLTPNWEDRSAEEKTHSFYICVRLSKMFLTEIVPWVCVWSVLSIHRNIAKCFFLHLLLLHWLKFDWWQIKLVLHWHVIYMLYILCRRYRDI